VYRTLIQESSYSTDEGSESGGGSDDEGAAEE
jgi:hypothetical protein